MIVYHNQDVDVDKVKIQNFSSPQGDVTFLFSNSTQPLPHAHFLPLATNNLSFISTILSVQEHYINGNL